MAVPLLTRASRTTLLRCAGLLSFLLLLACRDPEPPLRVGANVWPGYEPLFLAQSLGYFEGSEIRLIDFASAAEVTRAYRNGLIDVAAVTADESLVAVQGQPGHRIVLVCDFSRGADVLLAGPGIGTIRDLKGKRVGVESTALGSFMLGRALESGGLVPADVTAVAVPLSEHEDAFNSHQIDAVVTFEPHRSRLIGRGAHVLFDSARIPGEIVDVLIVRGELKSSQDAALHTLVGSWFRALDHLKRHPADAASRIAARESIAPATFLESLKLIELPDREANLRLLGGPAAGLTPALRRLSNVMVEEKLVARTMAPPHLDDSYVRSAAP